MPRNILLDCPRSAGISGKTFQRISAAMYDCSWWLLLKDSAEATCGDRISMLTSNISYGRVPSYYQQIRQKNHVHVAFLLNCQVKKLLRVSNSQLTQHAS